MRKLILSTLCLLPLLVGAQSVEPLLGSLWRHQEAPFNQYCPRYDGQEDKACLVGCVATACESILTYYGRTITLAQPLPGWTTDHYTIEDIPAGSTVVCSDEDEEAVARLGYWCGVACHMNYGVSASGANISRLEQPLRESFGLKYVHHLDSYRYTPQRWREILVTELEAGRPVLYAGYNHSMGGHAFVIDGVREDGLFHVNWGYGGSYDQHWYDLHELVFFNPPHDRCEADVPEGFFCNQEMLLLHPDACDNTLLADSIDRTGLEVEVEVTLPEDGLVAGQTCPMTFSLHNTSSLPLTTPFELFSNEPERTDSLFHYGDYAALFGATLSPGERRQITVPVKFSEAGRRILRLSADDETFVWESAPMDILPARKVQLELKEPVIEPSYNSARVSVEATNPTDHKAGEYVLFCLFEGDRLPDVLDNDPRHIYYLYTPGGQSEQAAVTFRGLQPDTDYTVLVRHPWKPAFPGGHSFRTQSVPEGVALPTTTPIQNLPAYSLPMGPVRLQIRGGRKHIII